MRTSPAPTMRIRPSTSKPIWVSQLKTEMGREPLGPNGARLMAKTVVPALRALQRAEPEQEVGQVAEDDDDEHLGEGQPEGHQDGAVDEVLDLHAGARPTCRADVLRGGPALALGDEVDPVLLDVERLVGLGVVNDRELLGDRHCQYLPCRRLGGARERPGQADAGRPAARLPAVATSVSRPRTPPSGSVRLPGERPKVCRPQLVCWRAPRSSDSGNAWNPVGETAGPVRRNARPSGRLTATQVVESALELAAHEQRPPSPACRGPGAQ